MKNAYRTGDELSLRLNAQELARTCPSVLDLLNPRPAVSTQYEALKTVLSFQVAPPHYQEDLLICLGLTGGATTIHTLYQSALRLARGVIRLLQAHPAALPADTQPNIPRHLADGSLLRYLEQ